MPSPPPNLRIVIFNFLKLYSRYKNTNDLGEMMKKALLTLALSTYLAACGGSDKSAKNDDQIKIGILTDSPVSGATYIVNGNNDNAKKTNANGEFEYQDGDVITFKIGDIEIGTVQGLARVTPNELVDEDLNTDERNKRIINLLIFLQSLDIDEDKETIQIPDDVSTLSPSAIDFSNTTSDFRERLQGQIINIPEIASNIVVSEEQAKEHFSGSMLKDIQGVWYAKNDESEIVLFIGENGEYMLGEPIPNEPNSSSNGMEYAKINLDALSGSLYASSINSTTPVIDTNEDWGLLDHGESRSMKLSFDGSVLKISEAENPDESAEFTRVPRNNSGIVGAWQSSSGKQIFVFNSNNTFIMVDAIGDDQPDPYDGPCGGPGIEYGRYQLRDNKLFVTTPLSIDTNGCAGLSDTDAHLGLPLQISTQSLSFTVADEGTFTLTRMN